MTFALNKFLRFLPAATFAMAAEYLMGLSDSVVCGHILGEDGLSAINLMQPVMNIVTFIAMLVGTGTSVRYAVEMGRSNRKRASEFLTQGLWSALVLGAIALVGLAVFRESAAESFGVSGAVLAGVKEYWLWFIPSAMLEPLSFYLSSVCYADGDDRICTYGYVMQLIGNCALSIPLTMFYGFAGCALGTAFGHVMAIAVLTLHFRKRTNSLHFTRHFSLADTVSICRASIGDASSRVCMAVLTLSLNLYVIAKFGEDSLPVLAVAIMVFGLSEVFDGVSKAIQPIASVYIGEGNTRLVKRIMKYASATSGVEGVVVAALLVAFPQIALKIVGISDPAIVPAAKDAVRIVSLGLVGTSFITLYNSYWTFISREVLSFALTTLAMLVAPVALFPILGRIFGIGGVWAALAISPYFTIAALVFFIAAKWGLGAVPLFLDFFSLDTRRTRIFDLMLDPDAICALSAKIGKFLATRRGVTARKATLTALLLEEALMVIREHNPKKRIHAEVSLSFVDNIKLTIRDDGEIFDITDTDAEISSLRVYLVSNLMIALPARRNMTVTGFNRNAFRI